MFETKTGPYGVVVINKYFNEDYSWNNFINSINDVYDLNNPNNKVTPAKEVIGDINFWQKLTMTIDKLSVQNFPRIEDKVEQLTNLHHSLKGVSKCTGYFAAVSLTDKEGTTGRHNDIVDVMYAQFIGSVVWTIFDESNFDKFENFLLNPGDIIYVPAGVIHEVKALSPRAAISFMFKEIDE